MQNGKKIKIIFEDNHLLVVEKPVNVPVQEDSTGDLDMLTLLKEDLKVRYNKPGNVFLGLVHRLDRPVGGVMVFAKTSKAASRLSEQIRKREFEKIYLAVVYGKPENSGILRHFLLKDSKTNTVKVVQNSVSEAKEAVLDYKLVQSLDKLSLLKINLHTGRPHQIRVQFGAIRHPLFGDQKYGAKQLTIDNEQLTMKKNNEDQRNSKIEDSLNKKWQQIALWANEIGFEHPTTKEWITFVSEPPKVFPWSLFKI